MRHNEIERQLEVDGRELLRCLYQAYLSLRAPGEAREPVCDAEGVERTEKRLQERDLETIFGTVRVERTGYAAEGSASLHPLDSELNLPPERYSPELRRRAAEEASKSSFDETVGTLSRHTGARVPKRQVEELVRRAAEDFEAFYAARQAAARVRPEKGSLVVLTSDGKGVVMCRQDLREATRRAAEKRRHKLRGRLTRGEKRHAKRMTTVASVYTIAPYVRTPEEIAPRFAPVHEPEPRQRPRPEDRRVWASLVRTVDEVLDEAFREARSRDPCQERSWVAVVDGNKTQLRLLKKLSRRYGVELTIVVDLIHVLEYLWKAALAFHAEGSKEREEWVQDRLLEILRGRSSHVAAGMRRSATLRHVRAKKRAPLDRCADYLLKYKRYLKYAEYLARGLPIATGVIEGACRHLVRDRMDLTGARWRLATAEAVLRLRGLRSSEDFDEYWRFHEAREYERHHTARYADGHVPRTRPPTDPLQPHRPA